MMSIPAKFFSLSVTTTQALAFATSAMMVSRPLRGRQAGDHPAPRAAVKLLDLVARAARCLQAAPYTAALACRFTASMIGLSTAM